MSVELAWEDVRAVAEKVEEVAPPVSKQKIATAFGISDNTLVRIAERSGWKDKLNELTKRTRARSVDEALQAVADLCA